ncbi:MAG: ABC transporter ATP-binding protein [Verrucomicrobia bacterium]|jgi:ABC-type Fe3+/spermidine/putrescine transport system ATPase subunit|nr:ABC transporter ATP-binding protein [Verrucomicrobiota bacterium]MBT7068036.1 ABC transporter ATP-binding protein [Verrucomicrobiota bacterium]MBT7699161.1 ABC transporter ATP-binding protein [Verrucomicrobiota bacterium]
MLTVENLGKSFGGHTVLSGVDLNVARGSCLALFGPSGCGKTTLLRLIAGLDDADEGKITIAGRLASAPHVKVPPHRRNVGMVFQDLALWPHMTARQNVEFMLPRNGIGRRERRQQAMEVLNAVQLNAHHDRHPHQLSGGEQQRLAIARAIAQAPDLLLLDEPFSSLDVDTKTEMLDLVRRIHAERKMTILYVTHMTAEVPALADRVACLEQGTIQETVSADVFADRYGVAT